MQLFFPMYSYIQWWSMPVKQVISCYVIYIIFSHQSLIVAIKIKAKRMQLVILQRNCMSITLKMLENFTVFPLFEEKLNTNNDHRHFLYKLLQFCHLLHKIWYCKTQREKKWLVLSGIKLIWDQVTYMDVQCSYSADEEFKLCCINDVFTLLR